MCLDLYSISVACYCGCLDICSFSVACYCGYCGCLDLCSVSVACYCACLDLCSVSVACCLDLFSFSVACYCGCLDLCSKLHAVSNYALSISVACCLDLYSFSVAFCLDLCYISFGCYCGWVAGWINAFQNQFATIRRLQWTTSSNPRPLNSDAPPVQWRLLGGSVKLVCTSECLLKSFAQEVARGRSVTSGLISK